MNKEEEKKFKEQEERLEKIEKKLKEDKEKARQEELQKLFQSPTKGSWINFEETEDGKKRLTKSSIYSLIASIIMLIITICVLVYCIILTVS